MNVRYHVELSQAEREQLRALLSRGKQAARRLKRAQILLAADAGAGDEEIAATVGVGGSTVYRTKRRFVLGNLEAALSEAPRPGAARKLTGKEEALLVATACSKPPAGRARWTLELLAGAMVTLTEHADLSRETVRRRLAENDLKPWRKDMWCIPQVDGTYVARMEDVLDLYAEAPDAKRPVVCFDESPTQLIGEVRERSDKLVRELVLDDPVPFVPLTTTKRGKETDYGAKAVELAGTRYIVCRNQQEAETDAAERTAILAALARQLERGDKALIGNSGYRRFLKTLGADRFAIDPAKVEQDARFDGIFVLRTNTELDPLAAMLRYKQLWTVEATMRTAKHLFATRPIFHKLDGTIRGHVFCSFLALVLKAELESRIEALGRTGAWPEILADLAALTETEVDQDGKRFLLRSAAKPAASLALKAAGVALPPTVQPAEAS